MVNWSKNMAVAEPNLLILIQLVRRYSHIYDKTSMNYRNEPMRNESFRVIAKTLNLPVEEVVRQWRNLRDRYVREIRKQKIGTTNENNSTQEWQFLEQMSFLEKHIRQRRSYRNSSNFPGFASSISPSYEPTSDSFSSLSNFSIKNEPSTSNSKTQELELTKHPDPLLDESEKLSNKSHIFKKDDPIEQLDSDDELNGSLSSRICPETHTAASSAFGQYVARRLDEMSPKRKSQMRLKIVKMLET